MARVLKLESLFELSCPVEMMSPEDTELPFIVEGIELFPNSDFMIEVRNGHVILASCNIGDGSISLQGASLQDAVQSSSDLQMRLVSPRGGYALAKTSIRIHPFYKIRLEPEENGIYIELPGYYDCDSDGNSSLRFYSTIYRYMPETNTIDSAPEAQFDFGFSRYGSLSFGTPPPEYDIAVLIRVVDGNHQREEYFPIRTQPLILGNISPSNTQLLQGEVPDVPRVDFIHHSNMPPEAIHGLHEFQRTGEDGELYVNPVVFNRAKWKMVPACTEGTCNRFGIKVHFSSVETDDDYSYLYSEGFFEGLNTTVNLGRYEHIDSQQLLAAPDGLECILHPTLKNDIRYLTDRFYKPGLNEMLQYSACDKVRIQVGSRAIESPPRMNQWDLNGEMFEFVCDDRGRFRHIRFFNGVLCTQHDADFFFVVNNQFLDADEEQKVQWEEEAEQALVTFPNIQPPIRQVEVKVRLPKFGSNPKASISIGVWERE
jgi:hypothetical protein